MTTTVKQLRWLSLNRTELSAAKEMLHRSMEARENVEVLVQNTLECFKSLQPTKEARMLKLLEKVQFYSKCLDDLLRHLRPTSSEKVILEVLSEEHVSPEDERAKIEDHFFPRTAQNTATYSGLCATWTFC